MNSDTTQPPASVGRPMQRAFASLPPELFLDVLDQLVGTPHGCLPIAYAPSDPVSKALRALTHVSRNTYLLASRYLYDHCVYLDNCTNYARFRRTMGLGLEWAHPEALDYGEAGRNNQLFGEADIMRSITSMFISPEKTKNCTKTMPLVRLPQIIDLGLVIGATLKRLAIDLQPTYTPRSEILTVMPHTASKNIFLHMPLLEDLICSYDVPEYFPRPPPNLKRLAMTFQDMTATYLDFCFSISTLEILVFLRPRELSAGDIDELFSRYHGRHLDVVLVDVWHNFATLSGTRDWTEEDRVAIWEAVVPSEPYAGEDELVLCDGWMWTHGVQGTLWTQEKRRMADGRETQEQISAFLATAVPL
jgi:hypothetical protein